jgi:hypothetical protein
MGTSQASRGVDVDEQRAPRIGRLPIPSLRLLPRPLGAALSTLQTRRRPLTLSGPCPPLPHAVGDGCGAFWRLRFQWAEGAASPASVKLAAGCPATGADLQELHDLETLDESELARVRAAADKWKTGLAALLGLVATVSVVKGRDSFKTLDVVTQHRIIILVGVALLFAASAALLAMRAANGPLKRTVITPK